MAYIYILFLLLYILFLILYISHCTQFFYHKNKKNYFFVFQMNWALTRTDTSRWLMKWTQRSPNWQDTRSLLLFRYVLCLTIVAFFLSRNQHSTFAQTVTARRHPFSKRKDMIKRYATDISLAIAILVINVIIMMKSST